MPIIMLTARADEVDRVLGLEVGADDYLSKPFSMRELLARVRAQLRRIELEGRRRVTAAAEGPIEVSGLVVDPVSRTTTLAGKTLKLTPTEFELLLLFAAHPGRAFSRDFLLERVWQNDYSGYERAVDTHVTRLRRKLGPLGDHIVTVWGVGYRFQPEDGA